MELGIVSGPRIWPSGAMISPYKNTLIAVRLGNSHLRSFQSRSKSKRAACYWQPFLCFNRMTNYGLVAGGGVAGFGVVAGFAGAVFAAPLAGYAWS